MLTAGQPHPYALMHYWSRLDQLDGIVNSVTRSARSRVPLSAVLLCGFVDFAVSVLLVADAACLRCTPWTCGEDLPRKSARPPLTIFLNVPTLLERIRSGVEEQYSRKRGGIIAKIFRPRKKRRG